MLRYKFISLGEDEVDTASRRVASHERIQTEGIVLIVFKSLHEAEGKKRRGKDRRGPTKLVALAPTHHLNWDSGGQHCIEVILLF